MFGSAILDTAVGILLVFLMTSLLCSALREALEGVLKQRALDLECGIRELLEDPDGEGLARDLYEHPLVYGLYTGGYRPLRPGKWSRWIRTGGKLPSYIPADSFARALIDLDREGRVQSPGIAGVMRALGQGTGDDFERLRANVEAWFEASGERIGGWYRRRTQTVLFVLGLVAAAAFNVNPLVIGRALFHEADLRAAVVATAAGYAGSGDAAERAVYEGSVRDLHALAEAGIPLGWTHPQSLGTALPLMLAGWLLTALAVMVGAPFWFDVLNRFMTVRSTIKPKVGARTSVAVAAAELRTGRGAAEAPPLPAAPALEEDRGPRPAPLRIEASTPSTSAGGAPPAPGARGSASFAASPPNEWRDGRDEGVL